MSDQKEFSLPEVGAEIAKKIRERIDQYGQEMLALRQRELKKSEQAAKCPLCGRDDKPGSCKCLDKPLESLAKGSQYVSPVKRFGPTVPKGQSVEPKPEDWKPEMKQVQGEETKKAELCPKCGKQCGTSDLAKCGETSTMKKGELKDARVKGNTTCNGCLSGWPGSGKGVHEAEHHGVKISLCDHCNDHLNGLKSNPAALKKAVGDMAPNAGNGAPRRIKIAPVKSAPAAPPQATGSARIAQVAQQPIAPMGLGAPKSRSPILAKAGLSPQMKQHAAIDASKAAAGAAKPPEAPKAKMPTPAEHAQRAAGFADFTPKAPKLPKAPSAAPAPSAPAAPAAPKPGIFGKLAGKKS